MAETTPDNVFPLYKMLIAGKEHWLPLRAAGVAYDFGWAPVEIGGLALDGVGVARKITNEERGQISEIADEHSASK
jgi:hypothetical protein